jgi:hypothetical protein
MYKYILLLSVFFLHAAENEKSIGSLLSPPPTAIPYGHFIIRNFFFFDDHRGTYQHNWESSSRKDSYHSLQYQLQSYFGLNSFFDISFSPRFYLTHKGRYAYCNIGDLIVGMDFQLLEDKQLSFFPGIKFAVREVFPLGQYQLFDVKRMNMEKTGSGCFATQLALFFYKGYLLSPNWFLNTTIEVQYQINSPINVKGFHSYGGGFGSQGKLLVGNEWQSLLNVQFIYCKAIIISLDALYEHHDGSPFYGNRGLNFFGKHCKRHHPSSERVSLAPSFAYQFPSNVGIMIGSWLSLCGRNTEEFRQYIANVFYTY